MTIVGGGPPTGKTEGQVNLIVEAFGSTPIGVYTRPDGEVEFIYRDSQLIIRDKDVDSVRRFIVDEQGVAFEPIERGPQLPGLVLAEVGVAGRAFIELLEAVDARFGLGVVTPNHVFYVVPVAPCPAEEPFPPGESGPFPAPCPGDGEGVRIHVPDTGIWVDPSGAQDPLDAFDWMRGVKGDPDPNDGAAIEYYAGHGTFIAGVIRCMARNAEVFVAESLKTAGADMEYEVVARLNGILDAAPPYHIISLSAGTTTRKELPLLAFEAFWPKLQKSETLLVAAAGNMGESTPFWPAAFSDEYVVSVGALTQNSGARATFSNFGDWVKVYAPGENLVNVIGRGRYTYREHQNLGRQDVQFDGLAMWSGTSFATPLVAGLIATRMTLTGQTSREAAADLLLIAEVNDWTREESILRACDSGRQVPGSLTLLLVRIWRRILRVWRWFTRIWRALPWSRSHG